MRTSKRDIEGLEGGTMRDLHLSEIYTCTMI